MDDALAYFRGIEPAALGLFRLLNTYGWHKMNALASMLEGASRQDFVHRKANFDSVDAAREVIAGSILQIAYFGIKRHGASSGKSPKALHFEAEMNRLIGRSQKPRIKRFELPVDFCVGREVGHLPIGMLVYAGRNQYNHFDDARLGVVNEVVFNQLNQLFPDPGNGLSFHVLGAGRPLSYSVINALGWTDNDTALGFEPFQRDMFDMLQIAA